MNLNLAVRLAAARKSMTVWALTLGLALTEALPYVLENLPLAREAFSESTYQFIVRTTFLLGIILRVRQAGGKDGR